MNRDALQALAKRADRQELARFLLERLEQPAAEPRKRAGREEEALDYVPRPQAEDSPEAAVRRRQAAEMAFAAAEAAAGYEWEAQEKRREARYAPQQGRGSGDGAEHSPQHPEKAHSEAADREGGTLSLSERDAAESGMLRSRGESSAGEDIHRDMEEISEFFRRDGRRYDGGFRRY